MKVGDPDGRGIFGELNESAAGLLCHECGESHQHLGTDVVKRHGMTAAGYREAHGLAPQRPLVSSEIRAKQVALGRHRAAAGTAAWRALEAARDPAAANAASRANPPPVAPEVLTRLEAQAIRIGKARRTGRVIECEGCGSLFCPLVGSARRRFCSRSCASKHHATRRQGSS